MELSMAHDFKVGQEVIVGNPTENKFNAVVIAVNGDEITVREEGTMRSDVYPSHFITAK